MREPVGEVGRWSEEGFLEKRVVSQFFRDGDVLGWVRKGEWEQRRTKGRSSRGPRWGASVSLAEAGCGRQKGVKDEARDTIRDQSLWGLMCLTKE